MDQFNYRAIIINKLGHIKERLESNKDIDLSHILLEIEVIKDLAFELDDFEVLGMASKLEMQYSESLSYFDDYSYLQEIIPRHTYTQPSNQRLFYKSIENVLYHSKEYEIDMSIYQEEVERNKDVLINSGIYNNLFIYTKNETATRKVHDKVRKELSSIRCEDNSYIIPSEDIIIDTFNKAKMEIYRLANKHVANQIELAAMSSEPSLKDIK